MTAYIDPGSGSYLFMLLIGGALGAVYKFRELLGRLWHRLTGRLRPKHDVDRELTRREGSPHA